MRAVLHGVIPATVGLGVLTAFNLARGLLGRRGGRPAGLALMAGGGLALALGHWPVILILCGAGLAGAALAEGGWAR